MGNAKSSNTMNVTENVMSSTVSNIIANQTASASQTQIISVVGGTGPVEQSRNKLNQKVQVNLEGVASQMSSVKTQQDIAQKLSQAAASSTSGVNLFNNSKSNNTLNDYLNVSMNVASNLSQICASKSNQTQVIEVDYHDGSVTQDDNFQTQVGNVVAKCIQDASATTASLQKVSTSMDQLATAKTVGVDIWAIVILILVIVLAPVLAVVIPVVVGANVMENAAVKFMGPICMMAGIFMIIWGKLKMWKSPTPVTPTIKGQQFSTLIKHDPTCAASAYTPQSPSPSSSSGDPLSDAAGVCLADSSCQGLDWDTSTTPPTLTYYNKLDANPCTGVGAQILVDVNISLVGNSTTTVDLTTAPGTIPSTLGGNNGDVYILNTSGKAFWRITDSGDTVDAAWQDIGQVPGAETNWKPGTIRAQLSGPTDSVGSDNDIWIDTTDPLKVEVWQRVSGKYAPAGSGSTGPNGGAIWVPGYATTNLMSFPGRHGKVKPPTAYNWSGYRKTTSDPVNNTPAWLMIGGGIGLLVFGLFMTINTLFKKKPPAAPTGNTNRSSTEMATVKT